MNKQLETYIADAIKTESLIENVNINPEFLGSVLQIYVAAGTMLDQIKKNAFYDKEFDTDKLTEEFINIVGSLDTLKPSIDGIKHANTKMMPDPGKQELSINPRIFHAIIGTATESVELVEALVKSFDVSHVDDVNLLEEFGDIMWYFAILCDEMGGDWQQTLDTNIAKLKARYPDKFTNDKAINRDLTSERVILNTLKK